VIAADTTTAVFMGHHDGIRRRFNFVDFPDGEPV
jgi:hypothetical protein